MQSASSLCFSLGSTSRKNNSASQFGHKTSLMLFAVCFLKWSFHYLEETFRDTHSYLSLIKTNIRPGQARYISSIAASSLPLVPPRDDHSKASSLEVPLFAQKLWVLGGAKQHRNIKIRFSMVDPWWTMPRKSMYHITVWLLIHHPTVCTPLLEVYFRSSRGQESALMSTWLLDIHTAAYSRFSTSLPKGTQLQHCPSCQSHDELEGQEAGYTSG